MANSSVAKAAAIILAGGSSRRMKGAVEDKVLWKLNGKSVIAHSVEAFQNSGIISSIIIVCKNQEQERCIADEISGSLQTNTRIEYCRGGNERQDSVYNGIQAISTDTELVFIHDGARPNIKSDVITSMGKILEKQKAVSLAHRVTDTIKKNNTETDPTLKPTTLIDLDRKTLWAMETPQAFQYEAILNAYEYVVQNSLSITDDNAAYERIGGQIQIFENPYPNPKLTKPEDLGYLEYLFQNEANTTS